MLFGRGRGEVRSWRDAVAEWLGEKRRLRLKSPHARVRSCAGHLDAVGKRIAREAIQPFAGAHARFGARIARESRRGRSGRRVDAQRSIASSVGHLLYE